MKIVGSRKAHHYPKIQLSFLLILEHWKATRYCGYRMMCNNMGIFNEEIGEITFSVLSRCVLGDTVKDNIQHMNRMFSLLPVYKAVTRDVQVDRNAMNTITWRHKIKMDCDELKTAEVFFKRVIRQIKNDSYYSYDGSVACYTNTINAGTHMVKAMRDKVYMNDNELNTYITGLINEITIDIQSHFVHPHRDIWPECIVGLEADDNDLSIDIQHDNVLDYSRSDSNKDSDEEKILPQPLSPINYHSDVTIENENDESNNDDSNRLVSPYENRSWNAWGTISRENLMIGRRARLAPRRLTPSKRRM